MACRVACRVGGMCGGGHDGRGHARQGACVAGGMGGRGRALQERWPLQWAVRTLPLGLTISH